MAVALLLGGIGFVGVEAWLRGRTLQTQVTWTMAQPLASASSSRPPFPALRARG